MSETEQNFECPQKACGGCAWPSFGDAGACLVCERLYPVAYNAQKRIKVLKELLKESMTVPHTTDLIQRIKKEIEI